MVIFTNMLVESPGIPSQRERILDAAERLFMERGFAAVTLRDIGTELDTTHAALYYHFPGGKEALFAEVAERNVRRHGEGLAAAIEAAGIGLRARLRGAAAWLVSQPPMDLIRMTQSDFPSLPDADAGRIMSLIYELILLRLQAVFETARASGEIADCDPGLVAGGLVGMVESLHSIPVFARRRSLDEMACELLDIVLRGLGYREGGTA